MEMEEWREENPVSSSARQNTVAELTTTAAAVDRRGGEAGKAIREKDVRARVKKGSLTGEYGNSATKTQGKEARGIGRRGGRR